MQKGEKIQKLTKKQIEAVKGGLLDQYGKVVATDTKNQN